MSSSFSPANVLSVAPGQRVAWQDDFVLAHLTTVASAALAHALLAHGQRRGEPSRIGLLYLIEPPAVGVPGAPARDAFVHLSRSSEPYYAASVLVVPRGFAAGTASAFVQLVRAASRGRLPLAIFSEIDPALAWLRQSLPTRSQLPTDDAIHAMVAALRASASSG